MSDSKRATLITVDSQKSAKNSANKTVRLNLNLDESNERKYTALNYKELVIAEEKNKKRENGKTGLDPFSDNDDDVERVARKFEQKYGGQRSYGKKGRSKCDDFADIGAGYDENDSFIDNTDGYDEMIPPECDTVYGGFYINSGSLEFKSVPENQISSDTDVPARRNKRRISSTSQEEDSSETSSSSQDVKEAPHENGEVTHTTEHRKKNKKADKKAKRIKRNDSSAATSGKQTSDDNAHGDNESADSRTSQSDSMTSKPAPSSENAITSDSSRDAIDDKLDSGVPSLARTELNELRNVVGRLTNSGPELDTAVDAVLVRLNRILSSYEPRVQKRTWLRVARVLNTPKPKLLLRVKTLVADKKQEAPAPSQSADPNPNQALRLSVEKPRNENQDNKASGDKMSRQEREMKIAELLQKLKVLIDEKKPGMISNYNAECFKVQEEKKKLQTIGSTTDRRLPKRRFPWCNRTRDLVVSLAALCGDRAVSVLASDVLPLFPKGFVRMPTLLRQANLKSTEQKRPPLTKQASLPTILPSTQIQNIAFPEQIQFPSSLTVTTTLKNKDKDDRDKHKNNNATKTFNSQLNNMITNLGISNKELIIEKHENRNKSKDPERNREDKTLPTNNIGSITITPVNNMKVDKLQTKSNSLPTDKNKEPLIRIKSPADLMKEANELAKKEKDKEKHKKERPKEKPNETPLYVETNFQPKEKLKQSPNQRKDEISQKKIDNMRSVEDKIPRPALIPVQHSPTFAKPDKRPPDPKKKKDIVIMSDLDPLEEISEPLAIDDSSSDVEVIENDKSVKNNVQSDRFSETVPSKDKCVNSKVKDVNIGKAAVERMEVDETDADIDTVMRSLREMQDSQEPNLTSSFTGVLSNERTSLNSMDGCSPPQVNVS